MSADTTLTCRDCGQAFTFTSGEQDFYASRGFSEPSRCAGLPRGTQSPARWRWVSYSSYGSSSSSYGGGGGGLLLRRWRRRARDVQRHVLELRPGGQGAFPAQRRQAGVLLDLLPAARRWRRSLRSGGRLPEPRSLLSGAPPAAATVPTTPRPGSRSCQRASCSGSGRSAVAGRARCSFAGVAGQ